MKRPTPYQRGRGRRPTFRPEFLEPRHLLTGPSTLAFEGIGAPAVIDLSTASPAAPVAVLESSPTAIDLGFSTPFNPLLTGLPGTVDIQSRDATGASWSSAVAAAPPRLHASPDGSTLQVVPGGNLAPGLYRIVFPPSSSLNDGTTNQDAAGDEVVAEFRVAAPGVGLGDAVDLGTVGPTVVQTTAALDLQANPSAVQLYKVELAPGHFWRLGLEVDAQRNGSPLVSDLSLFDAHGRLIATDTVGRSPFVNDPFLFAGLLPGTYYVGVSDAANVPGAPGGYDPSTGVAGTNPTSQAGGPFTLDLVADPQDRPTTLLDIHPDHVDPLNPNPTGFTLQFSGALGGGDQSSPAGGVVVVDQNGTAWPVTPIAYNEAQASISYVFVRPLPAGHYTIERPAVGGLVDLAGQPVVAPGQPSGVLGGFDVAAAAARLPNDLGVIAPGATSYLYTALDPGQTATFHFVAPVDGFYVFSTSRADHQPVTVTILGDGGVTIASTGAGLGAAGALSGGVVTTFAVPDAATMEVLIHLAPGEYTVEVTATGTSRMTLGLGVSNPALPDSVLLNGVGQGPALDLRLIAPTVPTPDAPGLGPNTTPTTIPTAPTTGFAGPSANAASAGGVFAGPSVPAEGGQSAAAGGGGGQSGDGSGLILTLGGDPVGLPSAGAGQVGVVGPGAAGSSAAVASSLAGIPQPLVSSLDADGLALGRGPAAGRRRAEPEPATAGRGPTDGAIVVAAAPSPTTDDDDLHDAALADLGWIDRVRARIAGLVDGVRDAMPAPMPTDPRAESIARIARAASGQTGPIVESEREQVAHAGLASPLNLGLAAMLAFHYRRRARRRAAPGTSVAAAATTATSAPTRRHPGPRPLARPRARV
ncbi:MAG TPA: hypothetical protein VG406_00850 [Isosphaeraceae bacterium]|jgi:hypothetical protein|nr:hypothetical protein [Isosphaeraceae bacterium]